MMFFGMKMIANVKSSWKLTLALLEISSKSMLYGNINNIINIALVNCTKASLVTSNDEHGKMLI
jgi:hypothetical protein